MAFEYHFWTPNDVEFRRRRRDALDYHGQLAQLSIVPVLLAFQIPYLVARFRRSRFSGDVESQPSSPQVKHHRAVESPDWKSKVRKIWNRFEWWTGDAIVLPGGFNIGWKGDILLSIVWTTWLLFLCIRQTEEDYLHLTKRFGIVGASQLPLHYMLAMKSPYSPLQLLCRTSHEQLNRLHRALGRIIQLLFSLHAIFYLNFYIQMHILSSRIRHLDVIIGITGISLITILGSSALGFVRRRNYRIFYTIHIIIASVFLPLMYFHVHHIRIYVIESLLVYVAHIALRLFNSRNCLGKVTSIAKTNLVQVDIPAAAATKNKNWAPGQHIYLRPLSASRLRSNPFTISSIAKEDGSVVLIARALKGNTKELASLASNPKTWDNLNNGATEPLPAALQVEGPYGASKHLPDLLRYDRILLVAGGVGATFILPIWRSLLLSRAKVDEKTHTNSSIRLVWAVRSLADASWATAMPQAPSTVEEGTPAENEEPPSTTHSPFLLSNAITSTDETDLYVTNSPNPTAADSTTLELSSDLSTSQSKSRSVEDTLRAKGISLHHGRRPPIRDIVDESFAGPAQLRVAVLVCGPRGLTADVRREVGRWVARGRGVYWHAEEFGY